LNKKDFKAALIFEQFKLYCYLFF